MEASAPLVTSAGTRSLALEMGRFSADFGLKTIYNVFSRIADPGCIVHKASQVFDSYYKPGTMTVERTVPRDSLLRLTGFDGPRPVFCGLHDPRGSPLGIESPPVVSRNYVGTSAPSASSHRLFWGGRASFRHTASQPRPASGVLSAQTLVPPIPEFGRDAFLAVETQHVHANAKVAPPAMGPGGGAVSILLVAVLWGSGGICRPWVVFHGAWFG